MLKSYQLYRQDKDTGEWERHGVAPDSHNISQMWTGNHHKYRRVASVEFEPTMIARVGGAYPVIKSSIVPDGATPDVPPVAVQIWHPAYKLEQRDVIGMLIVFLRGLRKNTLADSPGQCTGHTLNSHRNDTWDVLSGSDVGWSDLDTTGRATSGPPEFFTHPYLTKHTYETELVSESNIKAFGDMFEASSDVTELSCGTVLISAQCNDPEILEVLGALDDYPLIDEELHSEMEMEDQETQWDDWGRSEFTTAIAEWLAAMVGGEIDPDCADEGEIDDLYRQFCEEGGHYPESSGGNCTFPDYTNPKAFDEHIAVSTALECFTFSACTMVTTSQGDGRGGEEFTVDHMEGDAHIQLTINQDGDQPTVAPLGWCNSASISAEADKDRVTVTISTGDPRGAFCMEVHRGQDGRIFVSVPQVNDPAPHEDLKELQPGLLVIGRTEPKEPKQ